MKLVIAALGLLGVFADVQPRHISYQPQHYRFSVKGMKAEDGNDYPTLEPYVAFGLGVVQMEGPKHKDKDVVTCTPQSLDDAQGKHIELDCDDGSKFGVAAVSFPEKGS